MRSGTLLHITNGDAARLVLERAVQGDILPWRDVLHEGPVRADLSLEELSRMRVDFIASAGWGARDEVARQFAERDEALKRAAAHDEVVLWFEHDLYDQLQLVQLLGWFHAHPHQRLTLVCESAYLGSLPAGRAAALFKRRKAVSSEMLKQARAAWCSYGGADPWRISIGARSALPFLGPALRRHLEEFPWTGDGLSRLERQALRALAGGPLEFRALYRRAHHESEDPLWLGDTAFAWHLNRLALDGLVRLPAVGRRAALGRCARHACQLALRGSKPPSLPSARALPGRRCAARSRRPAAPCRAR